MTKEMKKETLNSNMSMFKAKNRTLLRANSQVLALTAVYRPKDNYNDLGLEYHGFQPAEHAYKHPGSGRGTTLRELYWVRLQTPGAEWL